jgi:hypothetical protein
MTSIFEHRVGFLSSSLKGFQTQLPMSVCSFSSLLSLFATLSPPEGVAVRVSLVVGRWSLCCYQMRNTPILKIESPRKEERMTYRHRTRTRNTGARQKKSKYHPTYRKQLPVRLLSVTHSNWNFLLKMRSYSV